MKPLGHPPSRVVVDVRSAGRTGRREGSTAKPYSYAGDDPLNETDPLGLAPNKLTKVLAAVGAAIASFHVGIAEPTSVESRTPVPEMSEETAEKDAEERENKPDTKPRTSGQPVREPKPEGEPESEEDTIVPDEAHAQAASQRPFLKLSFPVAAQNPLVEISTPPAWQPSLTTGLLAG